MKKIAPFLVFFFIFNSVYSQKPNEYEIEKQINITYINLEIKSSALYKPNGGKTLIGIILTRHNDSISYLGKQYDKKDTIGDSNLSYRELFMKNTTEIPTSVFDDIVFQLKHIDIEKVNRSRDFNITDGNNHSLTFSGNGYEIKAETNTPEAGTKERGLEKYLKLCQRIWKLSEL